MFAYRHYFHAGNFADVFKHALLSQLIISFQKKERPIVYVDTHAGLGRYDLMHPWADKNKEFNQGASQVFDPVDYPTAMEPYLRILNLNNENRLLRWYPGSPVIARSLLRPKDRLVLNEFNVSDAEQLRGVVRGWPRTSVRSEDGFSLTNSVLPPDERRGLIFMDPSYDRPAEFDRVASSLELGLKKFSTGVFAIWYPVMNDEVTFQLIRKLKMCGNKLILRAEICLSKTKFPGLMNACGVLIVNPPYQFEVLVDVIGDWLLSRLDSSGEGRLINQLID
ncbi:MAG: 23S rRNA (adenine(2030)-N(6))-methyltransferase RlmJ [Proteobacteria bacterium]|jgi:23S rRNA (adenine2030-N6)-methyltransferase|nr:23S rRNA (adenine(2030)-N(6))-methyltransferase RlmJ [Pseudomonadota bacterium]MDA1012212.1 23S rRNA (adenine(2030)-N(6))-methyltransferase RlmJ [Pseudomonadota bacterium]